jgi:hypothetical protein
MKKLDSLEDQMRGTITYDLGGGRYAHFDAGAVRKYGIAELLRAEGIEPPPAPTERLPVIKNGERIGTMAPDFDPDNVRSNSFFYDPRPGDFRQEGDAWIAARNLGASDPDCVVGFIRDSETTPKPLTDIDR